MIFVSTALSLMALAGGMILLAKANKDNLGLFFRIIAYFIIIAGFLILACIAFYGTMKFYGKSHFHKMMKYEKFREEDMGFHHMRQYGHHGDYKNNCCFIYGYGKDFDWRKDKCCRDIQDSCYTKTTTEKKEEK